MVDEFSMLDEPSYIPPKFTVAHDILGGHITLHIRTYETIMENVVARAIHQSSIPVFQNGSKKADPFASVLLILQSKVEHIEFHPSGKEFVAWQILKDYWENRSAGDMDKNYRMLLKLPVVDDSDYTITNEIIIASNNSDTNVVPLAPAILTKIAVTKEEKKSVEKPSKK